MMGIERAASYLFVIRCSVRAATGWLKRNKYKSAKATKILARLAQMNRVAAKKAKAR